MAYPRTPTQRAGYITYMGMLGNRYKTEKIAEMLGMTVNGAWQMMDRMCDSDSGVPWCYVDGYWQILGVSPHDMPW